MREYIEKGIANGREARGCKEGAERELISCLDRKAGNRKKSNEGWFVGDVKG